MITAELYLWQLWDEKRVAHKIPSQESVGLHLGDGTSILFLKQLHLSAERNVRFA